MTPPSSAAPAREAFAEAPAPARHDRPADGATALIDALELEFDPAELADLLELARDQVPARVWEQALLGPAREFLERPGKQFRARLVGISWRLAGAARPLPASLALAVEVLHAGSLIVDDVQDGSLLRRGGPALHHLVGLPVALNTANWMYFWAARLVARAGLPPALELAITHDTQLTLLRCHHGQALDLSAHVGALRRGEVPGVVAATTQLKTGALLALAARIGARAAGAPADAVDTLGRFGGELGAGLQMLDDLGSLANPERLEKGDEDLRQGRPTWPWAWLAERSDDATWTQLVAAQREIDTCGRDGSARRVETLAAELCRRVGRHGRAHVHARLAGALAALANRFGRSPVLHAVEQEVSRLEASYG